MPNMLHATRRKLRNAEARIEELEQERADHLLVIVQISGLPLESVSELIRAAKGRN